MKIGMNGTCLHCYFGKNMETALSLGSEAQALAFGKDLMQLLLSAPEGVPSPWFGPGVSDLFQKHYGLSEDRYVQEKLDSNRFFLAHETVIADRIAAQADPVYAGLQFAILGNYIDFSALKGQVSFEKLEEMLNSALEMDLDRQCYAKLQADLIKGKKLLYLTDNAGEIGFDKLCAQAIARTYPHLQITFCVRGGPALNDATREDAAVVGVPFPVIDNGNRVPGTDLEQMGDEARQALQEADVILAKGMANVETLFGRGHNIYFAFLVKCQMFADIFGKPLMSPMLVAQEA